MRILLLSMLVCAIGLGYTIKQNEQGKVTLDPNVPGSYQIYSIPALGLTADGVFTPLLTDSSGKLLINASGGGMSNVNIFDSLGNQLSSSGGALNVNATVTFPASIGVTQVTSPWVVDGSGFTQPISGSVSVSNFPATQPVSGTVTSLQGTTPWVVDGSGVVQPVSGTVTANQGGTWTTGRTWVLNSGTDSVSVSNFPSSFSVTQGTSPWVVSGTVNAAQSGTWTTGRTWNLSSGSDSVSASVSNFPALQDINLTQLGGATPSATNWLPSRITNGTAYVDPTQIRALTAADVVTANQGGTWTTGRTWNLSSASDSVAAVQSGTWTTGRTWLLSSITDSIAVSNFPSSFSVTQGTSPWVVSGTVAATQSGTWNINNISGTISLPTGAATEATLAKLTQTQGSTTSGQSGPLIQGAVTTASPTYTTAQTSPLSLTTAGALRTDSSATTQPISGTVTANQGGTWTTGRTWTLASGTDSVASVQSGTWTVQPGNTANTTPWLTTINQGGNSASVTASNALKVDGSAVTQPISGSVSVSNFPATQSVTQGTSPWVISGTVTANAGTGTFQTNVTNSSIPVTQSGSWAVTANAGTNLNTSALALDTSVNGILVSQASSTSGEKGPLIQGAVTTAAPTYTTGQTNPLSLTTAGLLRVDLSSSGTSSTNVSQFGGSNVVTGTGTSGSGIPRVTVANDSNVLATQSGTWTVNPDSLPVTQSITVLDTGTSNLTGSNGQVFYFGTPTVGSAATFNINGIETAALETSSALGTGTLVVEVSQDNGGFWFRPNVFQPSTQSYSNSFTAPFMVTVNTAGMTQIRVRSITSWSGATAIKLVGAARSRMVTIGDALPAGANIIGAVTQSGTWNVNATVTLPTGASTSANQTNGTQKTQVVDGSGNILPSGDVVARAIFEKVTDGTNTAAVKAASTAAVAADPALVVSVSPNTPVSTKTNLTVNAPAGASVGVASASFLAANANRKGLVLVNTSNSTVSFGFGAAAVLNDGITLYPGGTFQMDETTFSTAAINAIASAAASNVAIQEFQ